MTEKNQLLLAFYGDDFTGSTDALESLNLAGAKTVLFLKTPLPDQLKLFPGLHAVGIAGTTRSMAPEDMDTTLRPALEALKKLKPRHVHYKVCSTFDSSPTVGSIGKAIEIGIDVFKAPFVPLLVATPNLGRYCVFGNLFAQMGIGSTGSIYRLDRHPSMSKHPITPSDESDLRLHLARQTKKTVGLLDILNVDLPFQESYKKLRDLIQSGSEIVLFDALYKNQMQSIGKLLDTHTAFDKPLFSVGSSGIGNALGDYWAQTGQLQNKDSWPDPGKRGPLLVVSGSCSPTTSKQINWALSQGFSDVAIDSKVLMAQEDLNSRILSYAIEVVSLLRQGKNVIVHTCLGPSDPRILEIIAAFSQYGLDPVQRGSVTAKGFGRILGLLICKVLEEIPFKRLLIAGGDTSGYISGELGIEAMEMIAPLGKGAPLCKVYAPGSPADGLEVNYKGGQVGGDNYFGLVLEGKVRI